MSVNQMSYREFDCVLSAAIIWAIALGLRQSLYFNLKRRTLISGDTLITMWVETMDLPVEPSRQAVEFDDSPIFIPNRNS